MHAHIRIPLAAALLAAASIPAAAQSSPSATPAPAQSAGKPAPATKTAALASDLLMDLGQVERKTMALARAIPADKFNWRPSEGARSVGEVLLHVAADNYLLPAALGYTPDASTGIKGDDYKTAQAFESRKLDRDATLAELEKSFAFLRASLTATTEAKLGEQVSLFGQKFSGQQTWILTATHLHEHLGQLIAYARANNVTPPWSQGG